MYDMTWVAGTPPKPNVLTVRVPDALLETLRRLAEEQKRSLSDVVRLLLEGAVGPHRDGERHGASTIR